MNTIKNSFVSTTGTFRQESTCRSLNSLGALSRTIFSNNASQATTYHLQNRIHHSKQTTNNVPERLYATRIGDRDSRWNIHPGENFVIFGKRPKNINSEIFKTNNWIFQVDRRSNKVRGLVFEGNNQITDADISEIISFFPHISEITICNCEGITDEGIEKILDFYGFDLKLKIKNCPNFIGSCLKDYQNLDSLTVSNCKNFNSSHFFKNKENINYAGFRLKTDDKGYQLFKMNKYLLGILDEMVDIQVSSLDKENLVQLKKCKKLKYFSLDSSSKALKNLAWLPSTVKSLNIKNNSFFKKKILPELHLLQLENCPAFDGKSLKNHLSLKHLTLENNTINYSLPQEIGLLKNLHTLNLKNYSYFSSQDIKNISTLPLLSRLTLSVENKEAEKSLMPSTVSLLASLPSLTHLELTVNLNEDAWEKFTLMKSLKSLTLIEGNLKNSTLKHLAKIDTLKDIRIYGNNLITSQGIREYIKEAYSNKNICLHFDDCFINDEPEELRKLAQLAVEYDLTIINDVDSLTIKF